MKNFVRIILVVLVMSLLIVSNGSAMFTSTDRHIAGSLASGTIKIDIKGNGFALLGLKPGDSGEWALLVYNIGTLPYEFSVDFETEGPLFEGDYPVEVWVTDIPMPVMQPGDQTVVHFAWEFPSEAGNEYQDTWGNIFMIATAWQVSGIEDTGTGD